MRLELWSLLDRLDKENDEKARADLLEELFSFEDRHPEFAGEIEAAGYPVTHPV